MSSQMESDPTDPILGKWVQEGPTTLDAENIYVGLVRSFNEGEEPPENPTGVCVQMAVRMYGVPLAMVAKFDIEEGEKFAEQLAVCIEAVKTGKMPEPAG